MKRVRRFWVVAAIAAAFVVPAAPASADDNPCKGDGTSSKCRPPCELRVDPGDPAGGIGPTVEYYCP